MMDLINVIIILNRWTHYLFAPQVLKDLICAARRVKAFAQLVSVYVDFFQFYIFLCLNL